MKNSLQRRTLRDSERFRGELAEPGGDKDGPGINLSSRCGSQSVIPIGSCFQIIDGFRQPELVVVLAGLEQQIADEIRSADGGKPCYVMNLFLRIHSRDLAAGMRQGIDNNSL